MKEILGSLWVWEDVRDFTEEIAWSEYPDAKCFQWAMYNQKLVHNYSCTGQAACQTITNATWIILPLCFRKKVWERQLETWATEKGDYTQNGVKQAVKLFNEEFPELEYKLQYFRTTMAKTSSVRNFILEKGSSIVMTFKGSLYADWQDNWIIDNPNNSGNGGHVISVVRNYKEETIMDKYADNYQWVNEKNIIAVPELDNNKNFYQVWYYLKKVAK